MTLWSLAAGLCWGAGALLLGARAFQEMIWPGVAASPLIGTLVGRVIQPRFMAAAGLPRAAWALGSLYLGATLFGLAIGSAAELSRWSGGEALVGSVAVVLWGTTAFAVLLWPLAYLTHAWLAWRLP